MKRVFVLSNSASDQLANLAFVAQCLDELLFDHSYDSYRAPALNSHLRAIELNAIAHQLRETTFFDSVLRPLVEECRSSFQSDQVLSADSRAFLIQQLDSALANLAAPDHALALFSSLLVELQSYSTKLRNAFAGVLDMPTKKKSEMYWLATAFVVQVELEGFSRRFSYFHLQRLIEKLNKQQNVDPIRVFQSYLREFTRKQEPTTSVIFRGAKKFLDYRGVAAKFGLEISLDTEFAGKFTKPAKDWLANLPESECHVVINELPVQDPVMAILAARSRVESFGSSVNLVRHSEALALDLASVALPKNDLGTLIQQAPDPMKCGHRSSDGEMEQIRDVGEMLQGDHLDTASTFRFRNALRYHTAALHSPHVENQLLDLWAAFESLLPQSGGLGRRVDHFTSNLGAVLLTTYLDDLLVTVGDELNRESAEVKELIKSVPVDGNWVQKVAAFVVCEELDSTRISVAALLSKENPLLLFRLFQLHEKLKSKAKIASTLVVHEKKIVWHIGRIYYMRNSIVHSANSLPYLPILVQHLHMYVDELLHAFSSIALSSSTRLTLEEILALIVGHHKVRMSALQIAGDGADQKCSLQNYRRLLFGAGNPLSQF
jgi:hypothetical protein